MSIEYDLEKKAQRIEDLMNRVLNPLLPLKVRESGIADGGIGLVPESVQPGEQTGIEEENVAKEIAKELISFINGYAQGGSPALAKEEGIFGKTAGFPPDDELYNPIKKWVGAAKKKIHEFEKMNERTLDMDKVVSIANEILFSADPGKIQQETGIQVSPEVAVKIKEITSMDAGVPDIQKEMDDSSPSPKTPDKPEPPTPPAAPMAMMPKAAGYESEEEEEKEGPEDAEPEKDHITLQNKLEKLLGAVLRKDESGDVEQILNEIGSEFKDLDIKVLIDKLDEDKEGDSDEDYAEFRIMNVKHKDDFKDEEGKMDLDFADMISPRSQVASYLFWEYAKNQNKVGTVERIFEDWANKNNLGLEEAKLAWDQVRVDIVDLFDTDKEARLLPPSAEMKVVSSNSGGSNIIYSSVFAVDTRGGMRSPTGLVVHVEHQAGDPNISKEIQLYISQVVEVPADYNENMSDGLGDMIIDAMSREILNNFGDLDALHRTAYSPTATREGDQVFIEFSKGGTPTKKFNVDFKDGEDVVTEVPVESQSEDFQVAIPEEDALEII